MLIPDAGVFCCFKQFNHWISWVNIKHTICFCWLKQGFWNAAKTRFIQVHLPLRCWKRLEDCGAVVDSPFSCSWTSKLLDLMIWWANCCDVTGWILTYLDPWKSSARWHPWMTGTGAAAGCGWDEPTQLWILGDEFGKSHIQCQHIPTVWLLLGKMGYDGMCKTSWRCVDYEYQGCIHNGRLKGHEKCWRLGSVGL